MEHGRPIAVGGDLSFLCGDRDAVYPPGHRRRHTPRRGIRFAPSGRDIAANFSTEKYAISGLHAGLDRKALPRIDSVVRRIDEISTLPHIALQLMQVANEPGSSATDLKEVIEGDAALMQGFCVVSIPPRMEYVHESPIFNTPSPILE